jgi:hypothetical protein
MSSELLGRIAVCALITCNFNKEPLQQHASASPQQADLIGPSREVAHEPLADIPCSAANARLSALGSAT